MTCFDTPYRLTGVSIGRKEIDQYFGTTEEAALKRFELMKERYDKVWLFKRCEDGRYEMIKKFVTTDDTFDQMGRIITGEQRRKIMNG